MSSALQKFVQLIRKMSVDAPVAAEIAALKLREVEAVVENWPQHPISEAVVIFLIVGLDEVGHGIGYAAVLNGLGRNILVARNRSAPAEPDPSCRLRSERTATASPPARLPPSRLGTATRFDTTISRANIGPPSFARAASRSRSGPPSNRSAENFPTTSRFRDRYPPTASHSDCDRPTRPRTAHEPPRDDQATTRY